MDILIAVLGGVGGWGGVVVVWLPGKGPGWCQQSRGKVSWWLSFPVNHTHGHVILNVVLLITTVSLNEHCRYIIENKSRNRRDVVSRVVKVPGIILCSMLLVVLFVVVAKKCSIHHETTWTSALGQRFSSTRELNYSPRSHNPTCPLLL